MPHPVGGWQPAWWVPASPLGRPSQMAPAVPPARTQTTSWAGGGHSCNPGTPVEDPPIPPIIPTPKLCLATPNATSPPHSASPFSTLPGRAVPKHCPTSPAGAARAPRESGGQAGGPHSWLAMPGRSPATTADAQWKQFVAVLHSPTIYRPHIPSVPLTPNAPSPICHDLPQCIESRSTAPRSIKGASGLTPHSVPLAWLCPYSLQGLACYVGTAASKLCWACWRLRSSPNSPSSWPAEGPWVIKGSGVPPCSWRPEGRKEVSTCSSARRLLGTWSSLHRRSAKGRRALQEHPPLRRDQDLQAEGESRGRG